MYDVNADRRSSRLYITFEGSLDAVETVQARDEALEAAERLPEGFDVVTDIAGFRPPSPDATEPIKEAQAGLRDAGVDRVVRVVGSDPSQVVANAFQRRSQDVGYSGETVATREEVDRVLDEASAAGYRDD